MLNAIRNCQTILQIVPFYIPRNNVQIASKSLSILYCQLVHFSHWHSQVNNNIGYIFRCLFAICTSSFVKCGCKLFAYSKKLGFSYCWILYIFIFGSVHYIFCIYALQMFSPNFLNNVLKTSSRDGTVWSHHHHPHTEEPEIKLPTSNGSLKKHKVPEKHLLLLYRLCQSLWLCGSQQTVENSSRDGNTRPPYLPPGKPVCRSRSNI